MCLQCSNPISHLCKFTQKPQHITNVALFAHATWKNRSGESTGNVQHSENILHRLHQIFFMQQNKTMKRFLFTLHQLIWPFSAPVVCCLGYKVSQYGIIVQYCFCSLQRRASFLWEEGGCRILLNKDSLSLSLLVFWRSKMIDYIIKQRVNIHVHRRIDHCYIESFMNWCELILFDHFINV